MNNFETDTLELLKSLPINRKELDDLITAIEWEKELSWSNGYADAVDQLEEKSEKRFGNVG
jgi:hypothetical protein